MRWEDEAYVRVYLRDTPEFCALSWEARSLFWELMRKVDRAGVILVGKAGIRGLAGLVRMPIEVVERALHGQDGLLADGCVVAIEGGFIIPNYIPAQTAKQSDKARKQEQRARERARHLGEPKDKADAVLKEGQPVTHRDTSSQDVTERHEDAERVTRGHTESHAVTLSLAERSEAKQISISDPPENPNPAPAAAAAARGLIEHLVAALARRAETRPIARANWARSLLAGEPVTAADIDEGVAWAANTLALDAAPGGGAALTDRAIADRVKSGLIGAPKRRRNAATRAGPGPRGAPVPRQVSPEEFGEDGGWGASR